MRGLDLSGAFYAACVRPLLSGVPHAAALLGSGSEVLGFDDAVSTDHNFGPRLQVFLPAGADPGPVSAALAGLPETFEGFPVRYAVADVPGAAAVHHVEITTAADYFTAHVGTDPAGGMTLADWLLTPTQQLATLTAGAVFADPDGELARRRDALRWYPDDVWRYALAAGWLRVSQEEAFVGRAGARGDELGSEVVAGRLVRELMRLAFLVERRWAPYGKWLGTAFAGLSLAPRVGPHLRRALRAEEWRDREEALATAAEALGAATNALGLAPAVDASPRAYYGRDIRVLRGDRFTEALIGAVRDPEVRELVDGLGARHGGLVSVPGTVDQAVDSTDVLSRVGRCRAAAPLLGLRPVR